MNLSDSDKNKYNEIMSMFKEIDKELEKEIEKPVSSDIPQNYHAIFRLHHQRNRFVFDMLDVISPALYKILKENDVIDHDLISFWKKNGYENLCCLRCIQPKDSKYGNVCYCRVPQRSLEVKNNIECDNCGCSGCSGY
jgi:bud site selection protein 31